MKNLPEFNFRFIIGFRHIFCRCRARQPVLGGESCRQFFICREKENTMNIKRAKQEIRDSIEAYLSKDEFVSTGSRRSTETDPSYGPPGIGKTQIMEQIARECGIALVSYTITHHTRQSAVGLPFIVKKNYGEEEFSVTEYTMSEIISSVYDKMEKTGLKEGILFIDEINCVSETLAPMMLQFLQGKTFGNQKVPEGWVIVTAAIRQNITNPSGNSMWSLWTVSRRSMWRQTLMYGRNTPISREFIRR